MENALNNMYIQKFGLRVFDQHLFWLLEELSDAVEGCDEQEMERAEIFYSHLLKILQKNSKEHQYNTTLFKLSQKPPQVIRRLFSMCFYLGIDPQSKQLWIPMVAQCLGVPSEWKFEANANTYITEIEENYNALKQFVPDLPQQPLPFHPCDPVLQGLMGLNQSGVELIPELTEEEARQLPGNALLYYDMKALKPRLTYSAPTNMIQLPEFQVEYPLAQELYGAVVRANEPIFAQKPGIPCMQEEMQAVMAIQENRKRSPDRKTFLAQQKGNKVDGQNSQHILPLASHERLRAKAKLQPKLTYEFIRGLLPQPPTKMEAYGYVFIAQKDYFPPQVKQQSLLNQSRPTAKNIGNQLQLTLTLAFMRASEALVYSQHLDVEHQMNLSRTFGQKTTVFTTNDSPEVERQETLQVDDLISQQYNDTLQDSRLNATKLLQSITATERKNDEIVIANIDGLDFPQPKLNSDQLAVGMQVAAGCYEVSISQLDQYSKDFLIDCVKQCQLFAQRTIAGNQPAMKKWSLRIDLWNQLKTSIHDMIIDLQQMCQEVRQDVEFIDFEEVFK